MTYEPGTGDIMTTLDEPSPPDQDAADDKLLAGILRRAVDAADYSSSVAITSYTNIGPWHLELKDHRITADEYGALRRAWKRL